MVTLLLLLRIISVIMWVLILLRLFPSMIRAFRASKRLALDPIWCVCWWLAFNRVTFVGRNLFWVEEMSEGEAAVTVFSYTMAIILAGLVLKLRSWYGD